LLIRLRGSPVLESLIHLPRDLWRPTLMTLDEAHIYCPKRGSGEAKSTEAIISLMSQGRERGYPGLDSTGLSVKPDHQMPKGNLIWIDIGPGSRWK
jgi:hypothetical protein